MGNGTIIFNEGNGYYLLKGMIVGMENKTVKKDMIIFKEGENANSMYYLEKGEVKVVSRYGEKDELELATLSAGQFFGEMGLLENAPRSATIVAKSDVVLVEIDKDSFNTFLANNPKVTLDIMKDLSNRLRNLTQRYADACKTIADVIAEGNVKPKNEGLWGKLKKYADEYTKFASQSGTTPYIYYDPYLFL